MLSENNNKVLCILQARMGSTRLPGKTLVQVGGKTLLEHEIGRLYLARSISKIVVATSDNKEDNAIESLCNEIGIDCFRGSEEDVLGRYWQCARKYSEYNVIMRVTGDCPFIDSVVLDKLVEFFEQGGYDYASNVLEETFPDGMDAEIFKRQVLQESAEKASLTSEREHVTPYVRNNGKYKKGNLVAEKDYSNFRLTVDEPADLDVASFLVEHVSPSAPFEDFIKILLENPEVMKKNMDIMRNEGLIKSLQKDVNMK